MSNDSRVLTSDVTRSYPLVASRIQPDEYEKIEALTASTGETKSALIRRLIVAEIDRKGLTQPG